jgi:hypothetical protein
MSTTREAMLLTDFATIFAYMWYRDFPLLHSVHEKAQRADWTTHIGITVRSTADLMGLFTCFESGGRTDAVLRDRNKMPIAALEWEWAALHRGNTIINEFDKLKDNCAKPKFQGLRFAGLIGYARTTSAKGRDDYTKLSAAVLEEYRTRWTKDLPPLLLVVIHFEWTGKDENRQSRRFIKMTIDEIAEGRMRHLREQVAYPWDVSGSKWEKETGPTS